MASKKATVTTKKATKKAEPKTQKTAKKAAPRAKKATKKAEPKAKKATKKAAPRAKKAVVGDIGRTITATITLSGEPAELKASVEDIVAAAKKVIEKELRKQIRKA
jgi:GTP-binding protein